MNCIISINPVSLYLIQDLYIQLNYQFKIPVITSYFISIEFHNVGLIFVKRYVHSSARDRGFRSLIATNLPYYFRYYRFTWNKQGSYSRVIASGKFSSGSPLPSTWTTDTRCTAAPLRGRQKQALPLYYDFLQQQIAKAFVLSGVKGVYSPWTRGEVGSHRLGSASQENSAEALLIKSGRHQFLTSLSKETAYRQPTQNLSYSFVKSLFCTHTHLENVLFIQFTPTFLKFKSQIFLCLYQQGFIPVLLVFI